MGTYGNYIIDHSRPPFLSDRIEVEFMDLGRAEPRWKVGADVAWERRSVSNDPFVHSTYIDRWSRSVYLPESLLWEYCATIRSRICAALRRCSFCSRYAVSISPTITEVEPSRFLWRECDQDWLIQRFMSYSGIMTSVPQVADTFRMKNDLVPVCLDAV